MVQSARAPEPAVPSIVAVVGLKKSGKTTVVEALVAELVSRGYRVGSIKSMEHTQRFLDPVGADTRRHAEAGAEVVVGLLGGETVRYERGARPTTLREMQGYFNPGTHFLVCEGMPMREEPQLVLLCLRSFEELAEALSVRGLSLDAVFAISGKAAASMGLDSPNHSGLPVYDALDPARRRSLVDSLIEASAAQRRQP